MGSNINFIVVTIYDLPTVICTFNCVLYLVCVWSNIFSSSYSL